MAGGNGHSTLLLFRTAPQRVVSLVPSMTDSLLDLGVGASLVGVTDYCRLPDDLASTVVRVGGTRTADVDLVRSLAPEVVFANQEENERALVEGLEQAGVRVWVTFPRSVRGAMDVLWKLLDLYRLPQAVPRLQLLEATLEWTERASAEVQRPRLFCPIWYAQASGDEPYWMTFNQGTYAHDLLWSCGGANAFGGRERRYPLEADLGHSAAEEPAGRDTRYPCLPLAEIQAADPEVILLPDEPYPFDAEHEALLRRALAESPAVRNGRVHRVDGTLLTWHGTRLGRALGELPGLLHGS